MITVAMQHVALKKVYFVLFCLQGSVTAMTVFFPLDTARLRLQGTKVKLLAS